MKKLLSVILLLACVLLAGCSKNSVPKMTIAPAESYEDSLKLYNIPDQHVEFFDYHVDKSIQSLSIDLWHFENGEWVCLGQNIGNLRERSGRIGVRMNAEGCDIYLVDGDYHDAVHFPDVESFESALAVFGIRLSLSTPVVAGQEIELRSKVGINNAGSDMLPAFESFRTSNCDSGLAVTVTFSTESVD